MDLLYPRIQDILRLVFLQCDLILKLKKITTNKSKQNKQQICGKDPWVLIAWLKEECNNLHLNAFVKFAKL
jgi:hypothetical protein